MLRRTFTLLLGMLVLASFCWWTLPASASIAPKAVLTLDLQSGPLGVTLTLQGKNFHPGRVHFSYVDALGNGGVFIPPSDMGAPVQPNGSFMTSNLLLPSSGPSGPWRIIAVDNAGTQDSIRYTVLAAPGQAAGVPSVIINPTSGKSGDTMSFQGSNWLPQGTAVKLTLLVGTAPSPLLQAPIVSDAAGTMSGTFTLPASLAASQAMVNATDIVTGDLRAQTPITITLLGNTPTPSVSPSPVVSPTVVADPTPTKMPKPSPEPTAMPSPTNTPVPPTSGSQPGNTDKTTLVVVLLIVGGALGVAGLILILFLLPWGERRQKGPPGGQY